MIIRVLIAVVLAVPAYFYTMRYNIHMFQQNGYKNKEHIHWLKKKFRLQWILYFGLALGIVTCVFPYLALEIFEYLVLFVIIVVYRAMKRMNTKKKLVYTAPVSYTHLDVYKRQEQKTPDISRTVRVLPCCCRGAV